MKACPICGAHCFEDMETCFGCMHQFVSAPADDPFGESGSGIPIPPRHNPQEKAKDPEHRNQAHQVFPVKHGAVSVQAQEIIPVVRAQYQLTVSLEPL